MEKEENLVELFLETGASHQEADQLHDALADCLALTQVIREKKHLTSSDF